MLVVVFLFAFVLPDSMICGLDGAGGWSTAAAEGAATMSASSISSAKEKQHARYFVEKGDGELKPRGVLRVAPPPRSSSLGDAAREPSGQCTLTGALEKTHSVCSYCA